MFGWNMVWLAAYVLIMLRYHRGWQSLPEWEVPQNYIPKTQVSILIPARNEAENIGNCIHSLLAQDYPEQLREIIVIDDHSEDDTPEIVRSFSGAGVKLISLADHLPPGSTQSFKKAAIETAVPLATGYWIITTDADCVAGPQWLGHLASYWEITGVNMVAAPVQFYREHNRLERFQSLDFLGMMLITAAGIKGRWMHLANGANLSYSKQIFEAVGGMEGHRHLASGDDMLLMHKVAHQFPGTIGFVKSKEAVVRTEAKPTWRSFLQQRIRWATKSRHYSEWKVTAVLAAVYFFCWTILLDMVLIPWLGWWAAGCFIASLTLKSATDYFFLGTAAKFFDRKELMRSFGSAQALHLIYIVVVGTLGNVYKRYEWKGRRVQ